MEDTKPPNWEEALPIVQRFALVAVTTVAVSALLLYVVCYGQNDDRKVWNLVLVGTGSFGAGCLLGFIYGTFGSVQNNRFEQVYTAVSAALTGAGALDLSRPNSALSAAADALAASCGLPCSGGLVVLVMITFFAPGFMLLYVYKSLLLNGPIENLNQKLLQGMESLQGDDGVIPSLDPTTGEMKKPSATPAATAAAQLIVEQSGAGTNGNAEKLALDARAFSALGKFKEAEAALRHALVQKPVDWHLSYFLARILLVQGESWQVGEAIEKLKIVIKDPNASIGAWLLLGYAYLFVPDQLEKSIDASKKYLEVRPNEPVALFNLGRAYAQLAGQGDLAVDGTKRNLDKNEAIKYLQQSFAKSPSLKQCAQKLLEQDFKAIKDDSEFQNLMPPASPKKSVS